MSPTVEVLVCTYNGAAFVVEQLQSILKQTTRVDKVSIYDDRSADDTVARINGFVSQLDIDERRMFQVQVNTGNLGYQRNFINAIERATADLLFLCDQDDVWEPRKVESFLRLFEEHGTDMVFSDGSLIDEAGRRYDRMTVLKSYGLDERRISRFHENAFQLLLKRNYVNGAAAAIRRTAAQDALPLPCPMPHDYWLAIWCSLHAGIAATPQTLYRYRQHRRNVIGIGSSNPLYVWLGIWRHPNAPRARELHIWKAVTDRIADLPCQKQVEAARRKLHWLSRLAGRDRRNLLRAYEILRSALNGSYRRYSHKYAFLRDMVSLLK